MELSAPIFRLKRNARVLSRTQNMPLHQALDRVAAAEGFASWSLLAAKFATRAPAEILFARLKPGDLVLIGARPGHGKTMISLELARKVVKAGNPAMFFTLEYSEREVIDRLRAIGVTHDEFNELFHLDSSDAISADYIIDQLSDVRSGTLVVVDYLQILDQRRETPALMVQIQALRAFAHARGVIFIFISQIDRSYDPMVKTCPDLADVRLPNALDLKLFSKACFLNSGEFRVSEVGKMTRQGGHRPKIAKRASVLAHRGPRNAAT